MKRIILFIVVTGIIGFTNVNAQLERVYIETYYISDENDGEEDSFGDALESGSVTYRVYADLAEGNAIKALTGSPQHPFVIEATENFYNYDGDDLSGLDYGYQYTEGYLQIGTMALDSWLTIGFATKNLMGIPKELEVNDSIVIGGENNTDGMLVNTDPALGIPLTTADGLTVPDSSYDTDDFSAYVNDSTFGSQTRSNLFIFSDSANHRIVYFPAGISGPTEDNIVLIGQFTTTGEIVSFTLNLDVRVGYNATGKEIVYHYVGTDTLTNIDEGIIYNKWLSYPYPSGCTDPYFVEYDPEAVVDDGSCQDSMRLGCMEQAACNYDPTANKNVPELCCYGPNQCDDRDISQVCPGYGEYGPYTSDASSIEFMLYPVPAGNELTLSIQRAEESEIIYSIYNYYGEMVSESNLGVWSPDESEKHISVSELKKGLYFIRLQTSGGLSEIKRFVKE